ncbi:FAD-dependent oxidoreductase [Microterricola viridarii]|uniref:2-polyprenyl-6-methoxyphenol hydroxylase n=1 Tax=Microterricola viridarii TaxID=412690 RepID=A0A1H1XYV0_9MICO|nr:NAD(P)/FAD-dependent oxidoreductase [Microterricola viridarii]SDT14410.1 2-polyprenyl-6-methoxyphenol hydroxylase [Microterricola viridarii]
MSDTLDPGTDTAPEAPDAARATDAADATAAPDATDAADAEVVDVAVVGAGPVGLLLACLLVQRGLSVVVLEAREQASEHSRAIGIHPPGLAVLAQLGLADAAVSAGTPIFRGEAWCDGEVLGGLDISEAAGRYPFVLALPQRDTERLLRERLTELCDGRDPVRRGARVVALSQREDIVQVRLAAGAGLRARYAVGADGARSRVREYLGISWRAVGDAQPYLMGDFRSEQSGPARSGVRGSPMAAPHMATTALLAFEREGVVESFPLPGGWRRWVVLTGRLRPEATADELAAIVRQRTGIVLDAAAATAGNDDNHAHDSDHDNAQRTARSISAFAVRQHRAGTMAAGRVALLGDAAHEVSPIGGQGMNLGWLDAAALAPALELGVRGGHALGSRALADYSARRGCAARRTVLQASFNMGVGRPARGSRLAARNALVRLLARPPFRALLAQAFTMRGL